MKSIQLILILSIIGIQFSFSQITGSWREKDRTGVSPETGLLKSWPDGGPALLWTNLDLPNGYSSPAFGKDLLYITGTKDSLDILLALDLNGKTVWQTAIGRAWKGSFPDSRSTPTVEGDKVYTSSGVGDVACTDAASGTIIWSYKGSELNKGTFGNWGIAESILIDGDRLFFTPGGPETTTIALNKATGAVIWKSASLGDKPGYVSPILVNYAGKHIVINASLGHVFAIDAANGEILWKVVLELPEKTRQAGRDLINCVTPLYQDGMVYFTAGYDYGGKMIKMAPDLKSAEVVWSDQVLDVHHGGVVLINGYIYGANWLNNGNGNWCCIEWKTGTKMWEQVWNCKGSIIAAEGLLYIYDEKKGNVGLLKATPEKFDLISSFQVTQGNTGPFWAHPVINNGVLYLRHTNALMAYDIKLK
jgi:outer membrane protein assembly factor BamB